MTSAIVLGAAAVLDGCSSSSGALPKISQGHAHVIKIGNTICLVTTSGSLLCRADFGNPSELVFSSDAYPSSWVIPLDSATLSKGSFQLSPDILLRAEGTNKWVSTSDPKNTGYSEITDSGVYWYSNYLFRHYGTGLSRALPATALHGGRQPENMFACGAAIAAVALTQGLYTAACLTAAVQIGLDPLNDAAVALAYGAYLLAEVTAYHVCL